MSKQERQAMTGKELRYAAKHKIPVHYELHYHDRNEGKDSSRDCVLEHIRGPHYFVGPFDIDLDEYLSSDKVQNDFPEGTFKVSYATGKTAKDYAPSDHLCECCKAVLAPGKRSGNHVRGDKDQFCDKCHDQNR